MRNTNYFTTDLSTNTALNQGNLVAVDSDVRTFLITSPRYQGQCATGSARHEHGIKRASHGLRGRQAIFCLMPESGECPRSLGLFWVLASAC
jgi:hypothetical protein